MDNLLSKLKRLSLIKDTSNVDAVLGLELKNLMERRLQSVVYKKGLANTVKQARQFIVHGHIVAGGKKITAPSYLVSENEEKQVVFVPSSSLSNPEHPERVIAEKEIKKEIEKTRMKKEKPVDEDLDVPEIENLPEKEIVIPEEAHEIEAAVSEEKEQAKENENRKPKDK